MKISQNCVHFKCLIQMNHLFKNGVHFSCPLIFIFTGPDSNLKFKTTILDPSVGQGAGAGRTRFLGTWR